MFRVNEEDELQVLLIYRREVWDLPKGKKENSETLEQCAVREVSEEVGCPEPEILDELATTYHEYERGNKHYGKTTYWYAMQSDYGEPLHPQEEEGIEKIAWVSLKEARKRVGYDNLREVLEKFDRWHRNRNGSDPGR